MSRYKDISGQKFGRLTALHVLHNNGTRCTYWMCVCEWAMNNDYHDSLTIDRIDVNGNYEPSNCRWVNRKQQQNNRRNTIYITYNEKTQTIAQWAEELNIKQNTIRTRYFLRWSDKECLFGKDN